MAQWQITTCSLWWYMYFVSLSSSLSSLIDSIFLTKLCYLSASSQTGAYCFVLSVCVFYRTEKETLHIIKWKVKAREEVKSQFCYHWTYIKYLMLITNNLCLIILSLSLTNQWYKAVFISRINCWFVNYQI